MVNTYLLTLLTPLLAGGNSLINSRLQKRHFFSKDYTTVLKGLCCIIVIYVHVKPPYDNLLQDAIGSFAYICVTIFFLISAYGMMLSVERKKDYLRNFWRNRLVALLIPAFLVNVVCLGLNIVNKGISVISILCYLNEYVSVLLQWCLWFYIVMWCRFKFFPKKKILSDWILMIGVIASSLYLYFRSQDGWCFERIGLIWGVFLYRYFDRLVAWMNENRIFKVILLTIIGGILGISYLKFKLVFFWGAYLLKIILGIALIVLIFVATSNRSCNDKISIWLGNISYEVYLSHGLVMGALIIWCPKTIDSGLFIFITVIITLILSTIVHSIGNPIVNKLRT